MNLGLAPLLLLFPLSLLVPGFVALRGIQLPAAVRLGTAVGASLAILYAATFLLFLLGAGPAPFAALAVIFLGAGLLHLRELRGFLRSPAVATLLGHYALFAAWLLLLSLVIRNFSGGMWAGDWIEHFERARFFCGGQPMDTTFGGWPVTARPPLDNVVAAWFMRFAGTGFVHYQLAKTLMGSLQFLGAASLVAVLAPAEGRRWHVVLSLLAVLYCLNPAITQNATYTWTRALTSFFLLQGAALFVLALREGRLAPRILGYLHLGLAFMTHYSAVPYLVALAFVEARLLATRRLGIRDAVRSALTLGAVALPWFAFAIFEYGLGETVLSPSTVSHHTPSSAVDNVLRVLLNVALTLVPHPFRPGTPVYEQDYLVGYLRDYAFLAYQVSLPALMGALGGFAVAWLLVRDCLRQLRAGLRERTALVALFLGVAVLVGVGCVPGTNPHGMAHVCLQPLGAAGLAYLAARWTDSPVWLRIGAGVGLAVDAVFGIWAQFWMEHLTPDDLAARAPWGARISDSLLVNFESKLDFGRAFLGDHPGRVASMVLLAAAMLALVSWSALRRARPDPGEPG